VRENAFERGSTFGQGRVHQALAVRSHQHVEQNEDGRRLAGKLEHAALGRMQRRLQQVEGRLSPTGTASSPSSMNDSLHSSRSPSTISGK
jgi:hypothetical protein